MSSLSLSFHNIPKVKLKERELLAQAMERFLADNSNRISLIPIGKTGKPILDNLPRNYIEEETVISKTINQKIGGLF